MLGAFATAILGMILISCAWLAVQRFCQRRFPAAGDGDDALSGRVGCKGCDCAPQRCDRE